MILNLVAHVSSDQSLENFVTSGVIELDGWIILISAMGYLLKL
jgi:hypothetical protein